MANTLEDVMDFAAYQRAVGWLDDHDGAREYLMNLWAYANYLRGWKEGQEQARAGRAPAAPTSVQERCGECVGLGCGHCGESGKAAAAVCDTCSGYGCRDCFGTGVA
jgi:hypothetical protein